MSCNGAAAHTAYSLSREIQVVGYLLDGHLRGTQLGLGIENHRLGYPFGHAPVADLLDHRGEVLRRQTQFPGIESRCPLFPVVAHDKLHEPFEDFLVAGQPAVVLRMFGLIQRADLEKHRQQQLQRDLAGIEMILPRCLFAQPVEVVRQHVGVFVR